MEGLIFTIPVLLVFLFFFIQIFLLFKKIFSYIFKNISELNQEINDNYNPVKSKDKDSNEYLFNQTVERPEEDYIPITDRDINEIDKKSHEKGSETDTQSEIQKSKNNIRKNRKKEDYKENKNKKNKKNKSSASVFNFDNLNDLEKAVILKEILDKPRVLRK